jgi:signal transduction histidine kinase
MHDLRTPLSAILTAGLILEKSIPTEVKTGRVTNMLQLQRRNVDRLKALLKEATQEQYNIAASTIGELGVECREFELWPLIEDLIGDLKPLWEKVPVQILNLVPTDLTVFADALLLTKVFQNLFSNAIKYTRAGEITIGAERTSKNAVRCWVSDTGVGIAEERLSLIFEKLETDGQKEGSLGLGLTIVKQIIEAHGGQVDVNSTVGEGSTFTFTLPEPC